MEQRLLWDMAKKLCRRIVFAKAPLIGSLVVPGHFQLLPCKFPNAPTSTRFGSVPLVMEFWIDDLENPVVDLFPKDLQDFTASKANEFYKLQRLTRLISAISNHRIQASLPHSVDRGWQMPEESKPSAAGGTSKVVLFGSYEYPEMQQDLFIHAFSLPDAPTVRLVNHKDYYFMNPIENRESPITFSQEMFRMLHNYFNVGKRARAKLDVVARLICDGVDLHSSMNSLSFLAYVSSIETLASYHYRKAEGVKVECHGCHSVSDSPFSCEKCGKPIWGIKAKYKEFLKRHAGGHEESQALFSRIYNLRSKIVHEGSLLLGNENLFLSNNAKGEKERMTHLITQQASRFALANWLLMSAERDD